MKETTKNRILAGTFALLLGGGLLAHILVPDAALSIAERRKLAQAPAWSWEALVKGELATSLDSYVLDQFPARQAMRTVKAAVQYYALRQLDNNGVYLVGGNIGKLEYPLSETSTLSAAEKFKSLCETYFPDSKAYLAIVPDKSYYLAAANGYPALDYERMLSLLRENTEGIEFIELFDTLSADSYYRTDAHWQQDRLGAAVTRLAGALGAAGSLTGAYQTHTLPEDFYGVYYGQAALPVKPDAITYLTNPAIDAAEVYNVETGSTTGVYDLDKLTDGTSMDAYDVFLSGAAAVLEITNPLASGDAAGRELVIFRDSFGSSITPLLIEGYAHITLVDIRYIRSELLPQFVDFHGQDVLFLYSTSVINSSAMLR